MNDDLFLNLLSHLYSTDVATAPSRSLRHRYPRVAEALAEAQALAMGEARSSVNLSVLWASYFEPQRHEGHKVH